MLAERVGTSSLLLCKTRRKWFEWPRSILFKRVGYKAFSLPLCSPIESFSTSILSKIEPSSSAAAIGAITSLASTPLSRSHSTIVMFFRCTAAQRGLLYSNDASCWRRWGSRMFRVVATGQNAPTVPKNGGGKGDSH